MRKCKIGIVGFGTVGSGIYKILTSELDSHPILKEIEISKKQPWQNKNKVPDQVSKSALARGINISVEKWRNLNELDRFAFCKLVRPSHEHNNLDRAFDEILK